MFYLGCTLTFDDGTVITLVERRSSSTRNSIQGRLGTRMKHGWTLLLLAVVACEDKPKTPVPTPVQVTTVSVPSSAPAPAPAPEEHEPVVEDDEWYAVVEYDNIEGRWIGAEHGDAIPDGPAGGTIVQGGFRADIVRDRPGSKTPWNLTFWAPKEGHLGSDTISGGCGFYPYSFRDKSSTAFCRGYGLLEDEATRTSIVIEGTEDTMLRITVTGIVQMHVKR